MNLVESVKNQQLKAETAQLQPGDTIRVHTRIVEGDRERIQIFQGTVIRIRSGSLNRNFTVRRIAADGIGVERTFLLHSPRVEKIQIVRRAHTRRAKLYYLRGLTGKAARLKERREEQPHAAQAPAARPSQPEA